MSCFHSESIVKREATGKTRQIKTSHKSVMTPKIVQSARNDLKNSIFLSKIIRVVSRFHSESIVKLEATGKTRQITTSHKSVMTPKKVSECQKWPKKFSFLIKNHKGCESFPFRIYRQTRSHRQDKANNNFT